MKIKIDKINDPENALKKIIDFIPDEYNYLLSDATLYINLTNKDEKASAINKIDLIMNDAGEFVCKKEEDQKLLDIVLVNNRKKELMDSWKEYLYNLNSKHALMKREIELDNKYIQSSKEVSRKESRVVARKEQLEIHEKEFEKLDNYMKLAEELSKSIYNDKYKLINFKTKKGKLVVYLLFKAEETGLKYDYSFGKYGKAKIGKEAKK